MTVSLYDLLDVEQNASPDEIRAAWKVAIADLDPTDRRFRAYNDAAGVLLDPGKRAEYDAEIAAGREDADEAAAADEAPPAPAPAQDLAPAPVEAPVVDEPEEESVVDEPEGEPVVDEPEEEPAADRPESAGPPTWALLAGAALAIVSVALLVVVLTWPGSLGGESPADRQERVEGVEGTVTDAAAAAVPVLLSFDYRTFDENVEEADDYLTDRFAADRAGLLADLREEVARKKVVVTTVVSGTGLTRVSEDGDVATVVVYLTQDSQHGDEPPRLLRMWATLRMVAEGDRWLVDDICIQDDDCS